MNEDRQSDHIAGIVRTLLAILAVLIFWSAVGYGFWPNLAPRLLRLIQPLRVVGAEKIESQYFDVRNSSSAGERQVQRMVERLEQDYVTLTAFIGRGSGERVTVLLTDGGAPAYADGRTLYVFYDQGVIDLSTAPFFLAAIVGGPSSGSNLVDLGFALYTVEETGLAEGVTGQSADAWVVFLQQQEALVSLEEAWSVEVVETEEGVLDFLRAVMEGGSFMRWVVETHGQDTAWALRAGGDVEIVLGVPLYQAEEAWLAAVAAKGLQPRPCLMAVPGHAVFRGICEQLEGEAEESP